MEAAFSAFEWCCEWISFHLARWAFIEVLEYVGKLSLVGALAVWIWEIPEREKVAQDARKSRHYIAWQTLNSAEGKHGDAGRTDALEDLARDRVSLSGIDITGGHLGTGIDLRRADLSKAYLKSLVFNNADLSRAYLVDATIEDIKAYKTPFRGARLMKVVMKNSDFTGCDFANVNTSDSTLSSNRFEGCNFFGAKLSIATFLNNKFINCSFVNASFVEDWEDPKFPSDQILYTDVFDGNNIYNVKNAPEGFRAWAMRYGSVEVPADEKTWLRDQQQVDERFRRPTRRQ